MVLVMGYLANVLESRDISRVCIFGSVPHLQQRGAKFAVHLQDFSFQLEMFAQLVCDEDVHGNTRDS